VIENRPIDERPGSNLPGRFHVHDAMNTFSANHTEQSKLT
jgi:hypothetical protein